MFDQEGSYDDGRGRFPDMIRARAPRGFRDQVKQVARKEGVSDGEFIRRAICERIERLSSCGVQAPPAPSYAR